MSVKKILLVEDEQNLRFLLSEKLKSAGYEVYEAANGEEGFAIAQKIKPDLIISDIIMPKKDGNQFYKELRKMDFGKNIPFIVLTARAKMRDYFEVIEVDDFLEKPVKTEKLLTTVKDVLKKREPKIVSKKTFQDDHADEDVLRSGMAAVIPEETEYIIDKGMSEKFIVDVGPQKINIIKDDQESKKKSGKKGIQKGKRVLIVENDMTVYRHLSEMLAQSGFEVKVAHTPASCFEEAVRFRPNIILSKYILPGMKVEKFLEILREMSNLKDIPIIVYNYRESRGDKNDILSAGASFFMIDAKEEELLNKVREFLGN
ncbi:MAG: response regulator [Candidatus Omnitrophota bacterium]